MKHINEKIPPLEFNDYYISANISDYMKAALIADLHDRTYSRIIEAFMRDKPDMIFIAGDLISWPNLDHNSSHKEGHRSIFMRKEIYVKECGHLYTSKYALSFLEECVKIAPTYYSLGNHEKYFDNRDSRLVNEIGVTLLDNSYVKYNDIIIGGLSSAYIRGITSPRQDKHGRMVISINPVSLELSPISLKWLMEFDDLKGFKILLCHHPEYYDKYLSNSNIDLILAGHAHGGQIRIGKQGLYAPGQGFLPKYTSGLYEKRMIVSRGIANVSGFIPRINNIREVIYINLIPRED